MIRYGLGPIGCSLACHAAARAGLALVGGLEADPAKVGRDLGEVIGLEQSLGVPVVAMLA